MQSLNKVMLIGRVATDPTIEYVDEGKIAEFSLVTDKMGGKDGGKKIAEFHKIKVTGQLVGIVEVFVTKGKGIYVEGALSNIGNHTVVEVDEMNMID